MLRSEGPNSSTAAVQQYRNAPPGTACPARRPPRGSAAPPCSRRPRPAGRRAGGPSARRSRSSQRRSRGRWRPAADGRERRGAGAECWDAERCGAGGSLDQAFVSNHHAGPSQIEARGSRLEAPRGFNTRLWGAVKGEAGLQSLCAGACSEHRWETEGMVRERLRRCTVRAGSSTQPLQAERAHAPGTSLERETRNCRCAQ